MTEYDPKPPERALPPSSSSGPTVRPPVPAKGTPTSRTKNKLAAESARAAAESPAAREQAARLRALSAGTAENSIGKNLMRTLTYTPHVSALIDNFGPGLTANLLMGSTRALATRPRGAKDELSNYRRPVISEHAFVLELGQRLKVARANGTLDATLQAFQAETGKSLQTVLGERIRDTGVRASLLKWLPAPLSEPQITRDAFLENIAVGYSYSNDAAATMNSLTHMDERRGGVPGKVLAAFGYKAGEPLSGAWGLQMRVFTPDPKKAKGQPVIIAFRGTEGISFDIHDGTEGPVDTLIGDFAKKEPGINQFTANRAWIDAVVKRATAHGQRITFVGHSLGGALAQEAAARYVEHTAGVVTFQSANIPQPDADRVAAYNKAHPGHEVKARHYRVEGDSVPTSGTASLPGEIHYFDRVSRPHGSQQPMKVETASDMAAQMKARKSESLAGRLLSSVPNLSLDAATSGHTVPALSTYMHGSAAQPADPQRQALMAYGIQDETTLHHPVRGKDGRPEVQNGHPVVTPLQDVGAVFAGSYSTQQDPRLRGEASRTHVMPEAVALINGGVAAKLFEQNIAFNTALHHLFRLASEADSIETFQKRALEALSKKNDHGRVTLEMVQEDIDLALQLNLDKSPRANAEYALKDLAHFTRGNTAEAGVVAGGAAAFIPIPGLSTVAAYLAEKKAREKYDAFINEFSAVPTLQQYHHGGKGGYEVELRPEVLSKLDASRLQDIWDLFHPGKQP